MSARHSAAARRPYLVAISIALSACTPERPAPITQAEQQPASLPPTLSPAASSTHERPVRTPPSAAEARAALSRVFGPAVTMVERSRPAFLAADLNGDESSDLVVVVRPGAGSLGAVNDELAPWIVREPRASDPRAERPRIGAADVLLAVVHGEGPAGWRSGEARQAWLLRGIGGTGLRVVSRDELRALAGVQRAAAAAGDVLGASTAGEPGLLFWTGADYVWCRRIAAVATTRRSP